MDSGEFNRSIFFDRFPMRTSIHCRGKNRVCESPAQRVSHTRRGAVALQWILAKQFVTSIIVGAKRVDQLQQNLSDVDVKLTEDEMGRLDEVSELPLEYSGLMIPR